MVAFNVEFAIQPVMLLSPGPVQLQCMCLLLERRGSFLLGSASLLEGFLPVQGCTCSSKDCGHGRTCQAITSVYSGERIIFS